MEAFLNHNKLLLETVDAVIFTGTTCPMQLAIIVLRRNCTNAGLIIADALFVWTGNGTGTLQWEFTVGIFTQ